jgi:F-type H+-transporting ATPase subunit b
MRPVAALAGLGTVLIGFSAMAEEVQKGMPQLDFKNPLTISQVVWLALIFVALYLLLSKWALPQVGAVLEMRAGRIAGDLDAARAAKAQADAAVAELTESTRVAHVSAQAEIAGAVTSAKQAAAEQSAKLSARLDAQLEVAEGQINKARNTAMGALRQVAAETAGDVIARLTGAKPDAAQVDRAVGSVLAARGLA